MSQSREKSSPEPEQTITPPTEPTRATAPRLRRVLACVLCQKRKVKCDRRFPCANCLRVGVQCVPAIALTTRQRRRRFPERELLERLQDYEKLLRQNDIDFEPLHPSTPESAAAAEHKSPISREKSQKTATRPMDATVEIWNAISRVTVESEDENEGTGHVVEHSKPHAPHRDDAVLEKSTCLRRTRNRYRYSNFGKSIWRTSTRCSRSRTHPLSSHASSTPQATWPTPVPRWKLLYSASTVSPC